ncbi:inosine-uridine preferring nucleoside hydrolase-like [Chelonus insularis]|uniref:inosine-uridine preferring nucleoside hydrolase-like n=1 Tax=Chelonus insularis TaxID=460826 RepID=UPI00158A5BF1|nr:inosine-uridine preferring nucleoside hydrolase-like [Chelonus insularis]XP_034952383.1 inosine-uridine preferring nucleoside hydrolase-like [Chelonus insularis]XP_034952384.1 inosine-uridine preferring nucleoside hydrolase-like [Chelonus insularis]
MSPKNIIVDVDAGHDDAVALILLLSAHRNHQIVIKAITCVAGNTDIDNVIKNVYRTLEVCDTTDIPVYRGACSPLISIDGSVECRYHGNDGFGDVLKDTPDISKLQKKHAVIAIRDIVTENPNKISVVCLAPLTNIALAIKLFPEILNDVKEFYVMGGNSKAQGNVTSQAEFNFYSDPESAHILFKSNFKPLWLLPWETCLKSDVSMDWRINVLGKINSKPMQFINTVENAIFAKNPKTQYYRPCDGLLAGLVLNPAMNKQCTEYHADVELTGSKTRGQVVLDHLENNKPNIFLIDDTDTDIFKEQLYTAFSSFCGKQK